MTRTPIAETRKPERKPLPRWLKKLLDDAAPIAPLDDEGDEPVMDRVRSWGG